MQPARLSPHVHLGPCFFLQRTKRSAVYLDRVPVKLKHNIRRLGQVLHETERRWRSSVLGLASARPNLPGRGEGADRADRAADHISSERAVADLFLHE